MDHSVFDIGKQEASGNQRGGNFGGDSGANSGSPPIDIIVYFMDHVGMHLKVIDGQNIEAGELFELVLEEMNLIDTEQSTAAGLVEDVLTTTREVFSLWLVSDLLELQLKSTHIPFKLVCYWEELLEKYTSAPEEAQQRDEPVIMFKRNVYCHRSKDMKIENERLLSLLYHEAKWNIMNGRYPLSQAHCDSRAALQAVITQKEMNKDESSPEVVTSSDLFGSPAYFKSKMSQYLPAHHSHRNWLFRSTNPEKRLAQRFNEESSSSSSKALGALYQQYLQFCWKLPYYGCAYFRGQAEHPGRRGLLSAHADDPVYVAVNVDGVYIIDMDDVVLLLGLYFEELSWQMVESGDRQNPNCMPCLFLQFPAGKSQQGCTKLLQIFSKEAMLMDNIIQACVELKRSTKDQTDGETSANESLIKDEERCEIVKNFERLALVTLDSKGKKIESTVREPKSTSTK